MWRRACLILILLGGCQSLGSSDRRVPDPPDVILPLWTAYQQCLRASDAAVLHALINQLEQGEAVSVDPPEWTRGWGPVLRPNPVRTSVDPRELGVACTLRAAAVLAAQGRRDKAEALYRQVLRRYPDPMWRFYVDHVTPPTPVLAAAPPPVPHVVRSR